MRVHLPAPLQSLGNCTKGGAADVVTRIFRFGVMLTYKKRDFFDVQWGCLANGTRLIRAEWRGQQVMAINCSKGNFNVIKKKVKISEWVNSGTGCLEAVKFPSLKRLKAQMENAEQF